MALGDDLISEVNPKMMRRRERNHHGKTSPYMACTTDRSLPSIEDIYISRCRSSAARIMGDPTHPVHGLTPSPQARGCEALRPEQLGSNAASTQRRLDW